VTLHPIGAATLFCVLSAAPAAGNAASRELRRQGYEQAYQLDHDQAVQTLRQAVQADPTDAATHRAIATITWLNLLFKRGALTVDDYFGAMTRANVNLKQPPPELAAMFREHAARALTLAEGELGKNPRSVEARFEVSAAVAQLAAYTATVEGRALSGFKSARRAYDEAEWVLSRNPARKDAGFIVGSYRYIVANLALPVRLLAYVVGFGGDRERGIRMVEEAAGYVSDLQTEAKIALVFIYNRERRYEDALRILRDLQRQFPKNRLLWLEAGATTLRAGRPREALTTIQDGMVRLAGDARARSFGEEALWQFKLGMTYVVLNRREEALAALRQAHRLESRGWVRGRTHTELGKLRDLAGDRTGAKGEYANAALECERDNDSVGLREARRLMDQAYTGR
jgi:tetratricopeptide (TPR) repeat protein